MPLEAPVISAVWLFIKLGLGICLLCVRAPSDFGFLLNPRNPPDSKVGAGEWSDGVMRRWMARSAAPCVPLPPQAHTSGGWRAPPRHGSALLPPAHISGGSCAPPRHAFVLLPQPMRSGRHPPDSIVEYFEKRKNIIAQFSECVTSGARSFREFPTQHADFESSACFVPAHNLSSHIPSLCHPSQ